ncbi:ATP-binding cassette domain-containing protein [Kribbella sp. CA-293567]|uniref:ATP-binding cassette domain-containing protein n=1 Tax=Kribbella sp. CA-293567 TaxID=3002436 RepID=UPI0022DDB37E|nr:ABC transporter ATP-binding protein [Kribbella sp. CA-293567]WBQ07619.1 ABC transporter ATP-binding protein [Kribbella sp. CA-293567]
MSPFDPVPVLRRYALHGRLMWRSAPGWASVSLFLSLTMAAARTGTLVTVGGLVGALAQAIQQGTGSAAAQDAWQWFAATAVLLVLAPVAGALLMATGQEVSAAYLLTVRDMTAETASHPYGIAHLEEPASAGRLSALAQAPTDWLFLAGVDVVWEHVAIRLGGLGALFVLATWNWWAAALGALGWLVLSKGFASWSGTLFDELLDVTGNDRRRAEYFHQALTGTAAAKEIRLFGLAGWLSAQYAASWTAAMRVVWANRSRGLRITTAAVSAPLISTGLLFYLLARDALAGAIAAGALVTLVQAVLALEAFGPQNDAQTSLARTTSTVAELARLRAEYGLPLFPVRRPQPDVPAVKSPGAAVISIRDVTFRYPSRDAPALAGLTLDIPAGQSVALVGLNGAGKSTVIKLLCGLYPCQSGAIAIDGKDPATNSAARRRVAVVFQDFVRYPLPLRDNVAAGARDRRRDTPFLEQVLSDAGGKKLLDRLEDGWDTVLSAQYTGGTDLSVGQWQRVALARALAAVDSGCGILVLDEPTAAMDVRAEAELFDRFLEITRGVTTLLVSHRLSSVRHAGRIVVLAESGAGGSRIVEDGSHEELLAAGGSYARLFALQAARFTPGGGADDEANS